MPDRFLIATDLSSRSDRALERGFRLAERHGARVHVICVVDDAAPLDVTDAQLSSSRKALGKKASEYANGVEYEIEAIAGDPFGTILDAATAHAPGLLVLGTHRERPYFDAIRETTAQRITRLATCPVLVATVPASAGYGPIVAACDFSPSATAALKLAAQLVPGTPITPVHAIHIPYSGMLPREAGRLTDIERSAHKEAAEADTAWRSGHDLPETLAATKVREGGVNQVLTEHVRESGANLLCLGAHGRVGQHRALLGSAATDLMRAPPCDLLIARPQTA